ncbi:hypothetical protein IAU59_002349 [Kwoniella sp. CBS 9459]
MHPLDQHDQIDPLIGHFLPPRGAGRGSRGNDGRCGSAHEDEDEDEEVDESEIENGVNDEVGGGTGLAGNVELAVTPSHGQPTRDCAFGSRGERKKSPATHESVNDGEPDERSVVSEGNEEDPISPESAISSFQPSQQPPTPISGNPVAQRLTTFIRERAASGATPRTRPARGLSVGNQISPSWESTNKTREVTLSGLLNALDGVASSEGRLLFCTTNWRESIDPALSRPSRCDVWVEFKHATASQARDLFLHFYDEAHERTRKDSHGSAAGTKVDPHSPPEASGNEKNDRQGAKASSPLDSDPEGEKESASGNGDAQIEAVSNEKAHLKPELSKSNGDHGRSVVVARKQHRGIASNITQFDLVPELAENSHPSNRSFTPTEIVSLAEEFASSIPDDTISVSALTGYLVKYKRRPDLAAACVGEWAKGGCAQDPTVGYADGLGA